MKTQSIKTLAAFCDESHLNSKLILAVVRQMGGWESFTGFIYNAETESFARRNRALIAEMAEQQADDFGTTVTEMIQGFGCFRGVDKPTDSEIGMALYAGKDGAGVLNRWRAATRT